MATTKLGRIMPIFQGKFVLGTEYKKLDSVYDATTNGTYIALKDNQNINVTDELTWLCMAKGVGDGSGGSDNNFTDAYKAMLEAAVPGTRTIAGMDLTADRTVEDFAAAGFGVGNNFSKHLGTITDTELLNNPSYPQGYEGLCDRKLLGLSDNTDYGLLTYKANANPNGYGQQILRGFSNEIWYRSSLGEEWNPWVQIPTQDNGTCEFTLYGKTVAGTPTYSARDGWWFRTGNCVKVVTHMIITNKGGMTGVLEMSGLPFMSNRYWPQNDVKIAPLVGVSSSVYGLQGIIEPGTNTVRFTANVPGGVLDLDSKDITDSFGAYVINIEYIKE